MTEYKGTRRKADILSGVEYKITKSKFLANNTVEYFTECGKRVIRLHDTDIMTFLEPDRVRNTIHLNTDGWKTPTTKERMEIDKTTEAETSLASFALELISGLTRSTKDSNAVLRSSKVNTRKIVIIKSTHSIVLKPKNKAKIITKIAMNE